jgi:hypothetical protein
MSRRNSSSLAIQEEELEEKEEESSESDGGVDGVDIEAGQRAGAALVRKAKSMGSIRQYATKMQQFKDFCIARGMEWGAEREKKGPPLSQQLSKSKVRSIYSLMRNRSGC